MSSVPDSSPSVTVTPASSGKYPSRTWYSAQTFSFFHTINLTSTLCPPFVNITPSFTLASTNAKPMPHVAREEEQEQDYIFVFSTLILSFSFVQIVPSLSSLLGLTDILFLLPFMLAYHSHHSILYSGLLHHHVVEEECRCLTVWH